MPQPTAHYLVARRSIPKEHWKEWWDKYKPYFGLGSSAPDLFYFPSIMRQIMSHSSYTGKLSDVIHSEGSYDLFCTILSMSKESLLNGSGEGVAEKQFAFSFGFYSHVVTDCVFHPYVYRHSGDHWATTNYRAEGKHKMEEFQIDRGIHRKIRGNDLEIGTTDWKCPGQSENLLNYSIAYLFNTALLKIYPEHFRPEQDISNENHPIQAAYKELNQKIPFLFAGQKIYLWGKREALNTSNIKEELHFFTKEYTLPELPNYTPQDLFNFSCVACRDIFLKSLDFFNNPSFKSASDYFRQYRANYLGMDNWNLDTGLPCKYNNNEMMLKECPEHYLYKTDELVQNYSVLQELYNSARFE